MIDLHEWIYIFIYFYFEGEKRAMHVHKYFDETSMVSSIKEGVQLKIICSSLAH